MYRREKYEKKIANLFLNICTGFFYGACAESAQDVADLGIPNVRDNSQIDQDGQDASAPPSRSIFRVQ
jgi:hypothetical protein